MLELGKLQRLMRAINSRAGELVPSGLLQGQKLPGPPAEIA